MTKALTQCLNSSVPFGLPTTSMAPPLARGTIQKTPEQMYVSSEMANNMNLSLNQILGLPYQIVMPQTEINQSISINNLPSLNDLALRTGINAGLNAGMGTIFASPRPVTAPSPVPLTTPQLILPISSLYSTNMKDHHLQLPIPILDRDYIDQYSSQQHTMHTKPQPQHGYGIGNKYIQSLCTIYPWSKLRSFECYLLLYYSYLKHFCTC